MYQRNSKYEKEAFQRSPRDYKEVSRLNQVIRFVQSNITTVYDIDLYITLIKTFGKIEFVECYFENMRLHLSVSGEGLMNLSVDASILHNGVEFVISELERSISLLLLEFSNSNISKSSVKCASDLLLGYIGYSFHNCTIVTDQAFSKCNFVQALYLCNSMYVYVTDSTFILSPGSSWQKAEMAIHIIGQTGF